MCAWREGDGIDGHAKLKPVFAQLLQLLNVLQFYNKHDPYTHMHGRVY